MARPKKTISRPYRITVRFTDMEYGLIQMRLKKLELPYPNTSAKWCWKEK